MRSGTLPAQVIMPFLGSHIGGSHVVALTLGEALSRFHGIECVVICPPDCPLADEARRRRLSVVSSGERPTYRHSLLHDLRRLPSRIRILRSYRSSSNAIVHCNDVQALKSWGPAAKLLGLPVIYHHHSLNSFTFLKRRVVSLADSGICVSDACSRSLSCFRERTTILNPVSIDRGIDRASARASLIEDFGLDRDARLVGFVANLFRRKRPFYFLDVCVHLARHVENFHGIVFGRAGDFEPAELRAYAEAVGLGSRVTFAGFRLPPGRNIAALDLLLAPALDEPFGLTLVEALLLGVPYVATSGEGHIEIHGCWKGGRLVPDSADPLEFAATALDVLKDPSRVVLGQAQRMKARQELSPKRHVDDVVRVYEQVMARRTNPAIGVRHY